MEATPSSDLLRFLPLKYDYIPGMPRRKRLIVPGLPHHITQRGNNRGQVFDSDSDRRIFLDLLARYSQQYGLAIWAYCLMTNHFHLVAAPANETAMANALGRVESDFARFVNLHRRSCGHLWQARYYSVPMDAAHCWRAVAYVERNPVRARMVDAAENHPWSSAAARIGKCPVPPWLILDQWRGQWTLKDWLALLRSERSDGEIGVELREATLSGYPLGGELVTQMEVTLGRRLHRGKSGRTPKAAPPNNQTALFG
jgi:putative transposase